MDLHAAAASLDVHYQTAYRWIRNGSLPAVKVGSCYVISEADLSRFRAQRAQPAPPPRTTTVRSWPAQQERLHALLVQGDELGVRLLFDRLHAGGIQPLVLCEELLAPVLAVVGDDWSEGRISVAVEHRLSAICERTLARITVHPRGRPRGVAVVCTPPGEEHSLPAAMAAVCLRSDRWQVHHLGTQVPATDIGALLGSVRADLLVLSLCNPRDGGAADAIVAVAAEAAVPVLVGGPGRTLRQLLQVARGL